MKRATITVPDDLMEALDAYLASLDAPPALTTVVQSALRAYLSERGYLTKPRGLRITTAERGSGLSDISTEHDREIAER
jgi:hypothetical protein